MVSQLHRYTETVRHLHPWQVIGRLVKPVARQLSVPLVPDAPEDLSGGLEVDVPVPHHDPWNDRADLIEGRVRFLNRTKTLGWPPDWHPMDPPLLWRFTLHYFHFLHLLEPEEQHFLCRSWIKANPVGEAVAWHPYPTSLRLVNWCRANPQASDVQESLYRQTAYLYRHLETHVMGNHLLENARALVYAGTFFEGHGEAADWRERGLRLYREELEEQILPDGGHYERSPMYHALMLEGLLDVIALLPDEYPDRPTFEDTARSMADALAAWTLPNGRLALFNDATREIAVPPARLLQYARDVLEYESGSGVAFPDTGYYVHGGEDLYCIVDGGAAGPDHLMAHAHADAFSYELCVGDAMFVTDTGVYEYEAGDMRDYVRSTAAHSTVTVDDQSQIEPWDSFRVARRAAPDEVSFEQEDGRSVFRGRFGGFAQFIGDGIVHRRRLMVDDEKKLLRVEDEVSGDGTHRVASRVQLHPDVSVQRDGEALLLRHENGATGTFQFSGGRLDVEQGWYCPEFGMKSERPVLVLRQETTLPVTLSYTIQF
ncbi:heparinase II/III family protein [Salinibacter ruber]|uniref:heparinase II/III family protein n=1 Tax=Salinibacter ruber TaxID=146919 RepID=UPI00216869BB|nr:alginate lyase family protein [Salinibacter ruber]MCS4223593.1 putative heparinase superfamily protein [Salinibacter ruber]